MKLSYEQMVIGLDKLFFEGNLVSLQQVTDRSETIDAYLEACGWSWDQLIDHLANEQTTTFPGPICH